MDRLSEGDEDSEGTTVTDLVGESERDGCGVNVVDHEDDGQELTVVDIVAELLMDSDVLFDRLRDALLVIDDVIEHVAVAVRDHVAL